MYLFKTFVRVTTAVRMQVDAVVVVTEDHSFIPLLTC